jgi:hypothetical protein
MSSLEVWIDLYKDVNDLVKRIKYQLKESSQYERGCTVHGGNLNVP